jgi:hypothetical protein
MKKNQTEALANWLNKKYKTYTPEEILAAGGADKFAQLINQEPEKIADKLPKTGLSEEEFLDIINILEKTK